MELGIGFVWGWVWALYGAGYRLCMGLGMRFVWGWVETL